jgi:speckle-type POZ protein
LNNETTADFNFKVKNCTIAAHKAIVGARSPLFATIFKQDMNENNEIEIEDVELPVFQKMLQFIYTNDCDVGEHAEELLIAADRYGIIDLKDICEEELKSKLTVDKATRLLTVSDKCQAKTLKKTAVPFINRNAKQVLLKKKSSIDA